MKARIKATGEIVNISEYDTVRIDKCDSYGTPIELSYDEVEILQDQTDTINWEQRRYEIAKDVLKGIFANPNKKSCFARTSDQIRAAMRSADALIQELKNNPTKD